MSELNVEKDNDEIVTCEYFFIVGKGFSVSFVPFPFSTIFTVVHLQID